MKKILLIKAIEIEVADLKKALNYVRHSYPKAKLTFLAYEFSDLVNKELSELCADEKMLCQSVKTSALLKILIRIWWKRFDKAILVISASRDYSQLLKLLNFTFAGEKTIYDVNSQAEIPLREFLGRFAKIDKKIQAFSNLKEICLTGWQHLIFFIVVIFFIIFVVFPLRLKKNLHK